MIKKVLIIDRSEVGIRALDVCVELNLKFVVGFSRADENSQLVKKALDYAKKNEGCGVSYIGGDLIEDSYANVFNIIETAKMWGCDAIYPGYGPLSENHKAIEQIENAGLKFIGPRSDAVRIISNRFEIKKILQKNKINVPNSFKITNIEETAREILENNFKYPLMLKSYLSGGGRGNRLIRTEKDLLDIVSNICDYNDNYYIEEYLSGKHIEVQFYTDSKVVNFLGVRDCSSQINFQKILEECPGVKHEKNFVEIKKIFEKLLVDLKYKGIGTIEFLYLEKENLYYFLEINPRIQVESSITEKVYNIDLVKKQFLLEMGAKEIKDSSPKHKGYAIEARVYARDVYNFFNQDKGVIKEMLLPDIEGVFFYSGYSEGDSLQLFYDPLILKIVCYQNTRNEAIFLMEKTLKKIKLTGVKNNIDLLLWLIRTEKFAKNKIKQDFIENAWREYIGDDNLKIETYLSSGLFDERISDKCIDINKLPNKIVYERNNKKRDYSKELKIKRKLNNKNAFRFGVFKKNGIKTIFAWWDFTFFGGTLGVDEAYAIKECFKMAHNKNLPVLMVSHSGGARQQENSFALHAMQYIIAVRNTYAKVFFINIYYKDNFGGINASIIEQADIKIAISGSRIGLAGSNLFSGIEDSLSGHYKKRNIDIIMNKLEEACDYSLDIFGLIQKNSSKRKNLFKSECQKEINKNLYNLTDLINPNFGVFDDVVMLSGNESINKKVDLITGAFARIGDILFLVLGQYVVVESNKKKYEYPGANDYKWFLNKIELADKLNIPIILVGDTEGANADESSEYDGISGYISNSLSSQMDLSVPIFSVNMGICGSGGGLPFINTADYALSFIDSIKLVANINIQTAIMLNVSKPTEKDRSKILKQLIDSSAKVQKKYFLIDEIIPKKSKEGISEFIKSKLVDNHNLLTKLSKNELIDRRYKRINRVFDNLL